MFLNIPKSSPKDLKKSTEEIHYQAVEKVIRTIYKQLGEPLSLQNMSEIASCSPFHFSRIFKQIVGIPPIQFLYALRLQAAKQLLLTTQLSVTDICYEVGYNSLGTFTSRFTQLVGLSPRNLRLLASQDTLFSWKFLHERFTSESHIVPLHPSLSGQIKVSSPFVGLLFVGLFSTLIPQGLPVRCTILSTPGIYRITSIPNGRYYIFATSCPSLETSWGYLLKEKGLRGVSGPIQVLDGQVNGSADITLRPSQLTEPPLLVAMPFLLNHYINGTLTPK